jgi:hypothetical protein
MLFLGSLDGSPSVFKEVVATVDAELVFWDLFSAATACGEFLVHREATFNRDHYE